jgi:fructose-1,6-bisphosphatase III
MPAAYRELLWELLMAAPLDRAPEFGAAILRGLNETGKGFELVRLLSRTIRNVSIGELIVAGDLGDRGPRIDKVIDYLMRQPEVAITWGNHDVSWMGACLGQEALIATVLRISLRYGQIAQLEEGYGIALEPLEHLARQVYGHDPAARFMSKAAHLEDPLLVARMQKAVAIMQLKLEAQTAARNPHFGVEERQLLRTIDAARGTVTIDGKVHDLLDRSFPTLDPAQPDALNPAERACMDRLKQSFVGSQTLWRHMSYLFRKGSIHLVRDEHLIFHGAVPVDAAGEMLGFAVDGAHEVRGRELFETLDSAVQRAWRQTDERGKDLLWYLWAGARSPLFGKDKMATFETYFVADKATHKETKNPYFRLINEVPFCRRILAEFGIETDRALIVNGHVPVKVEAGEAPVKKSGVAVTIDGAFSEAYGDRGYTLVLDSDRTYIARHHHFESVETALSEGADIVPEIADVLVYDRPRLVRDTDHGERLAREAKALERLITAYEENVIEETGPSGA